MHNYILVRGAKEHNLKNLDIDIPKNSLVVITGVSGSGKSSLAFDTIYAEGQRRYVESLSSYARQFLEMHGKPDVESIDGLSPAIAIDQKAASKNPRSTVATATEIYDYLRVLFARIGVPYSPATGLPIKKQSATQMVDALMRLPKGSNVILLAPVVRGQKGEHKKDLLQYRRLGYEKLKLDGKYYDFDELPHIDKNKKHDIELVVDRIKIEGDSRDRLVDGVESVLKISKGQLYAEVQHTKSDKVEIIIFSEKFSCPVSGFSLPEIEPRIFSFNSPYGACSMCNGFGKIMSFDEKLVIPKPTLSLVEGAIAPWQKKNSRYSNAQDKFYESLIDALSKHYDFNPEIPFESLPTDIQKVILYGSGEEIIKFSYQDGYRMSTVSKAYKGAIPLLEEKAQKTESSYMIEELSKYQVQVNCRECSGYRVKKDSLCVKINNKHIGEVSELTIDQAHEWFKKLNKELDSMQVKISKLILKEIERRLKFLINVGLDYLTLNRPSSTLSGGESQRIRLASQIGSSLTGVLYVLDEPSIGLHQADNDKLIDSLKELRDLGNSVLVVEHDEDTMRQADYLIDIGRYAGVNGGEIMAQGTPEEVAKNPESLTGKYLSGEYFIPVPKERRGYNKNKVIHIKNVTTNNLKNVDVDIPIGNFVAVTGVSGSGKSSLVLQTLYGVVMKKLHHSNIECGEYSEIRGLENIDKVIEIDQQPIGRTPRSNPATYTGVFSPIRDWFAGLKESKLRGYLPGRFSFNVKGGRCEVCEGDGLLKIEMHFLPDVYVKCEECDGKRYNKETLQIKYNDKTISDVLEMTVDEGLKFFENLPLINEKLRALHEVGLGYISIGQSATTLSGGEAQRIKLAKELSKKSTGRTLYILDEPTTGLHSHDIQNLLKVLHELVNMGNTIVVIEHNLDVIKTADYIIDIGPHGGEKGGEVVAKGTPEEVAKSKGSLTGKYLADKLR
ncbi:excinuclease ABC subunit UvrA [Candidatus Bandiella euplotis]|uniref:UvrABC system protein A n=1 Tax=Candidatus Bandiella euplotis TaxID=1664265 RepID=A0ABZ0UK87_9RICK|nr:excinuclease ABC subunit UvrA [Candidatus Bandiella woodruffii]WPX96531.1 UvrABC system protein A [Candidatus Bandiella woodruffii]